MVSPPQPQPSSPSLSPLTPIIAQSNFVLDFSQPRTKMPRPFIQKDGASLSAMISPLPPGFSPPLAASDFSRSQKNICSFSFLASLN